MSRAVIRGCCSVDGCNRQLTKHDARGMCQPHYWRWKKYGDPGSAEIKEHHPGRVCAVVECGRPAYSRDLCVAHYQRWRAGRDVGATTTRISQSCAAADCDRLALTRGWCNAHYERWRHGDEDVAVTPVSRRPHHEEPQYGTAHDGVRRVRGSAADHPCQHCGGDAHEWAYDHSDPDAVTALVDRWQMVFSLDPQHYMPLCRPCHRKLDNAMRRDRSGSPVG